MSEVVYVSKSHIERQRGPLRIAQCRESPINGVPMTVDFGTASWCCERIAQPQFTPASERVRWEYL